MHTTGSKSGKINVRRRKESMGNYRVAWNKDKTASVVLSKVKEFTIQQNIRDQFFNVRGWYNKENYFSFGDNFETLAMAQQFLDAIHIKM
jgi:hypothetical protein